MTNRQLVFGLFSGGALSGAAAWLAVSGVLSWTLALVGSGLVILNLLSWGVQRWRTAERSAVYNLPSVPSGRGPQ